MPNHGTGTTTSGLLRGLTIFIGFIVIPAAFLLLTDDQSESWVVAVAIIVNYLWLAAFAFVVADMGDALNRLAPEQTKSRPAVRKLTGLTVGPDDPKGWDEHFLRAGEICIREGVCSPALLTRHLRISYGRAARIADQLHEAEVVGLPDKSETREVLATMEDLEAIRSAHGL